MRNLATQTLITASSPLIHASPQDRQNCRKVLDFMSCGRRPLKEKTIKITNEAGMLLKTNKTRTFCHPN